MIKVLLVLNDGNHGGIAKVVLPILLNPGQCVFRVICGSDGAFTNDLRRMGVSVGVIDLFRPLFDIAPINALRREIRAFSAQIVHSHHSRAYLRGRIAAWLERVPHISTPHNPILDELDCRPEVTRFRRKMMFLREWSTAWLDTFTIALSDYNKQRLLLQGIRASRVRIIANGVDLGRFSPKKPDISFKESIGLSGTDKVVGVIGRLVSQKGIDDLIMAFSQVPERLQGAKCRLLIAGDGPDRQSLECLAMDLNISDKVVFLGHRDDINELLQIINVVVFPSRFEGLPFALLEAMASAKPIVAVDLPVFISILRNGGGLVVSRDKLNEGITTLLTDSEKAIQFGNEARRIVEEEYDQEKILTATRSLYHSVAI